jgi:hypothetical protein
VLKQAAMTPDASATTSYRMPAPPTLPAIPPDTHALLSNALALGLASLLVQIVVPIVGAPLGIGLGAAGMRSSTALHRHLVRERETAPLLGYAAKAARWLSVIGFWVGVLHLVFALLSIAAFFVSLIVSGSHVLAALLDALGSLSSLLGPLVPAPIM